MSIQPRRFVIHCLHPMTYAINLFTIDGQKSSSHSTVEYKILLCIECRFFAKSLNAYLLLFRDIIAPLFFHKNRKSVAAYLQGELILPAVIN